MHCWLLAHCSVVKEPTAPHPNVSVRRAGDNTAAPIQITNSGQGAKRRPTGWWLPETHVSGNGDGTEKR